MAPEPDSTPPESETPAGVPKKGLHLSKYLVYAGAVGVMIVASYFLQKTLLFSHAAPAEASPQQEEKREPEKKEMEEGEESKVVMLEEIIVNPAETLGRRYLSVTVGLQTRTPEGEKEIEKNQPLIRDALISLLSSKHLDQLARIDYRDTLKSEVRDAVSRQLHNTKIDQVVFTGYVLQ